MTFSTSLKAFSPISKTESGITNSTNPVQPLKAFLPISLIESGIVIYFKYFH